VKRDVDVFAAVDEGVSTGAPGVLLVIVGVGEDAIACWLDVAVICTAGTCDPCVKEGVTGKQPESNMAITEPR